MEEEISGKQVGIKYGLLLGLTGTIVFIVPALLRSTFPAMFLVYWAYFFVFLALGMKEYKKANGGYMSFGKGFGIGMTISLVGGLLRAIMRYVYLTVDTEYFKFLEDQQQNNPFGPPPDSGQDTMAIMEMFLNPVVLSAMSLLGAILAGLIFGAIVAAIVKNDEDEF